MSSINRSGTPTETPARADKAGFRKLLPWLILGALVAAYAVYFSVLSVRERDALYQFDEDLAIYDQIVWNTAHGHIFASTLIQHADNMLGDHFSPAMAIFVPIYWVWPNANVLLIGQSVLLALAAVPLFLFARRHLGEVGGLIVAAAYLVYPALHYVNLFQFHEITLLPLPLSVAMLAIERGSRRWFFGAALASLMVKEEVAIVVVGLGLLWWLRRRDWRTGAATIALGVVAGIITMGIILPHFNLAGSGYYYVRRYAYLGNTPLEIAFTALTSPGLVLAHLTTPARLIFLAELFLPLLLTPLLGWEYVVGALPVFGYLLLAQSPDQYAIDRHYLTPLLPFLFFGSVLGLGRIRGALAKAMGASEEPLSRPLPCEGRGATREGTDARSDRVFLDRAPVPSRVAPALCASGRAGRGESGSPGRSVIAGHLRVQRVALLASLLACTLLAANIAAAKTIGPTPFGQRYDAQAFTSTVHSGQIRRLMAEIPAGASVSASRNLLSWFSERGRVYRFPQISDANYILLDWRDLRYPAVFSLNEDALGKLFDSPDYRLIDSAGATTLWARGDPTGWHGSGQPTRFGADFELLDARARTLDGGSAVAVTLDWRALEKPTRQYTVFVHLLAKDGKLLGQADSWPLDNLYPTDMWQPGRIVPDTHLVTLRQPVPTAGFRVDVGLYDVKTGARLQVTARGLPGGATDVEIVGR